VHILVPQFWYVVSQNSRRSFLEHLIRKTTPISGSDSDPKIGVVFAPCWVARRPYNAQKRPPFWGRNPTPKRGSFFRSEFAENCGANLGTFVGKGSPGDPETGGVFQRGCHRNSAADSGDSRCQACGLVHASWGGRCERAWPPSGLLSWVMLAPSSPRLVVVRWRGNRGFGCTMARKTRAHVRGVTRLETYG